MTTIIERPVTTTESEGGSGVAMLGIIVGLLVAAVIAMVAYNGGFDRSTTNDTNLTITTPAAPSPEAAPKEAQPAPQSTPEPSPAPVQ